MAFYFSADEYRTLNRRATFGITPMVLLCYNMPPEIRFKEWNTVMFGLIPGPRSPTQRMDTFMRPLIDEFLKLGQQYGVETLDAFRNNRRFILRAYLCVVGADMMARLKMMGTLGHRAKRYCEYCEVCVGALQLVYCFCFGCVGKVVY